MYQAVPKYDDLPNGRRCGLCSAIPWEQGISIFFGKAASSVLSSRVRP
jgi:hypothetical protein